MTDFVKYQPKTWVSREFIKKNDMNYLEIGVENNSEAIESLITSKIDGWFIEDNVLYFTANGEIVGNGGVKIVENALTFYEPIDAQVISDTWEQILAAEQDGSYSTKYHVGDTKTVSIDGADVIMQIAAFDADTIAGGTEKAKISWVCKKCYKPTVPMDLTRSTTGGWPAMYMYRYLNSTVYGKIESTVKDAIKTVVKPYWDAAASVEKTSNDKLWLLSNQEVNFITSDSYHKEDGGVTYSGLFPTASNSSDTNRVKYVSSSDIPTPPTSPDAPSTPPTSPTSPDDPSTPPAPSASDLSFSWWLRSSNSSSNFVSVSDTGSASNDYANAAIGVVFGFCT